MSVNDDIARLLNILAQTTPQPPPQPPQPPPPQQLFPPPNTLQPPTVDPRLHGYLQPPQPPQPPATVVVVDPKTITDWPAALKYVTSTVYRNGEIMAEIKKMKRHQHEHERQWWAAREELVRKHEARVESNKKVTDLLKKLGTVPPAQLNSNLPTPESEREELRVFDRKVHSRSEEMVRHMASEFAGMGIPFFCRAGPGPGLSEEEDAEMRRRVVELLEDLCE